MSTTNEPSVALMLQGALTNIQTGQITTQHVDVLGKMMDLYERNEKRQAEKDFAASFVQLQSTMPQIVACKSVPGNDGTIRYKFAPYEEIMTKAKPALTACGFGITFDTDFSEGRVTAICTLLHVGGHSISKKFACRIGSGPPKASEAQGDGSAVSYAKRFALCATLNIVVEHDTDGDDARGEGDYITQAQADELRDWVAETNSNKKNFLAYAGAETFETIREARLESLHDALRAQERKNAAAK